MTLLASRTRPCLGLPSVSPLVRRIHPIAHPHRAEIRSAHRRLCMPGRAARFGDNEPVAAGLRPERSSPRSREWSRTRTLDSRLRRTSWRTNSRARAWSSPPVPPDRTTPAQAAPPPEATLVPAAPPPAGVVPTVTSASPSSDLDGFREKKRIGGAAQAQRCDDGGLRTTARCRDRCRSSRYSNRR
jgi:hypothetical protein